MQGYFDHTYRRVPKQYRGVAATRSTSTRSTTATSRPPQHRLRQRLSALPRRRSRRRPGVLLRPQRAHVAPHQRVRAGGVRGAAAAVRHPRIQARAQRVHRRSSCSRPRLCDGARSAERCGGGVRAVRVPTRFDTDLRFRVPNSERTRVHRVGRFRVRKGDRLRSGLSTPASTNGSRSTSPPTTIATTISAARKSRRRRSRSC